jgi:hypothetical protein
MHYITLNMFQHLIKSLNYSILNRFPDYRIWFVRHASLIAALIVTASGCSSAHYKQNYTDSKNFLSAHPLLEDQILSLNPDHVTEEDIEGILSRSPAPRVINLNGSIPVVTMDSFSKFLIAMGYPENSIRNPENGDYSYSSYISSENLAGSIAWYYEKEGMMPILIGHSQGGMMVVKVLHELAGAFHERLPVWNPLTGEDEGRYTIMDPLTNRERNVLGLRLGYASAIGTGKLMRLILGQWNMLGRLRQIPGTVEEFAGFHIRNDFIGSDFFGNTNYSSGSAIVRNVTLPAEYGHITIPLTEHLAGNRKVREWIGKYIPQTDEPSSPPSELSAEDTRNILFAAEQWFYIKKYWCMELQRLIRSRRENSSKGVLQYAPAI